MSLAHRLVKNLEYPKNNFNYLFSSDEYHLLKNLMNHGGRIIVNDQNTENIADRLHLTGNITYGVDLEKNLAIINITKKGKFIYASLCNSILIAEKKHFRSALYGFFNLFEISPF